jgi:hypothetical protein
MSELWARCLESVGESGVVRDGVVESWSGEGG